MKKMLVMCLVLGAVNSLNALNYEINIHNDTDKPVKFQIRDTTPVGAGDQVLNQPYGTINPKSKYTYKFGITDTRAIDLSIGNDWSTKVKFSLPPHKYYSVKDDGNNKYHVAHAKDTAVGK